MLKAVREFDPGQVKLDADDGVVGREGGGRAVGGTGTV